MKSQEYPEGPGKRILPSTITVPIDEPGHLHDQVKGYVSCEVCVLYMFCTIGLGSCTKTTRTSSAAHEKWW